MKPNILKNLSFSLFAILVIVACSEDEDPKTCVLQKMSIVSANDYWLMEMNENGTVASVRAVYGGVENHRYDYKYTSDKLSIYLTDLIATNKLEVVIGLDQQGRPISITHDGIHYQRLIYGGNRLAYTVASSRDSLVYRYGANGDNPIALDYYSYDDADQTWSQLPYSTTFTYDGKLNPMKGLVLPVPNWNVDNFLLQNNLTSYSSGSDSWHLTYTYNNDGYPVSRKLTSSFQDVNETTYFEYGCK